MTRQSSYSRRQFFRVGAAGVAATVVTAPRRGRGVAHAAVQGPPPLNTAPRVLRKPPLDELGRIAKSYDLDLSTEDLASFRTLMDGVLASYRRLDQFAEPTLPVKYARNAGSRPPRRVRARRRRDDRHPDPRRRRRDRRQGRLRAPLLLRGQPHLRHRAGAEPARSEALRRRLLERERGPRGRRRVRYGDRWRPGRVDPDPQLVFERRRPQADVRSRPVHGSLPDRPAARAHGPHPAHG